MTNPQEEKLEVSPLVDRETLTHLIALQSKSLEATIQAMDATRQVIQVAQMMQIVAE